MNLPHTFRLLLCLGLLALPLGLRAETYRMDVIVFLNLEPAGEEGDPVPAAPQGGVIDPVDAPALRAAGIEMLPDDQFGLDEQWQHLKRSRQFRPLLRLSWLQNDPPTGRGPSIRVKWGSERAQVSDPSLPPAMVSEVDGSVAMLLNHYLQLDADLTYTDADGQRYRLDERRRMRRDELHHLDSPKLGIVARVSKAASP
jgi:hypothetical protein